MKQKADFVGERKKPIINNETTEKVEKNFKEIVIPEVKEFLRAGVQFGHPANKWNPKMEKFIFGQKNGIHILDLSKTISSLKEALNAVQKASHQGEILFVGTKIAANEIVKKEAMRVGAHFVTNRWPGGLLTNFGTVSKSLNKLTDLEKQFEEGVENRTKQEISWMKQDWERLNRLYGGVKFMTKLPKAIFVVDVNFEKGAVAEGLKLGIPVFAIVDTNSDPSVDFPIPANDDAIGSISLITGLVADAVLDGNQGGGVKHMFKDYAKMDVEVKSNPN